MFYFTTTVDDFTPGNETDASFFLLLAAWFISTELFLLSVADICDYKELPKSTNDQTSPASHSVQTA